MFAVSKVSLLLLVEFFGFNIFLVLGVLGTISSLRWQTTLVYLSVN